MKRFTSLLLVTLALSLGVALLSKYSTEKKMVKTELVTHSDFMSVAVFDSYYLAEDTLEVIPNWTPKTIGNEFEGYLSDVYHPPTAKNVTYLSTYSKRL